MHGNRYLLAVLILLFCGGTLVAQSSPSNSPSSQPVPARRGGQQPCWQQAGIDKSVMEQRRSIEADTHSQIESVCSNSSLTPKEKMQQVREIRQQSQQRMSGLMTGEQQSALTSCQQSRGRVHSGMGPVGCGAMPPPGGGQPAPSGSNEPPAQPQ
jgi:hypothetical protein